MTFDELLDLVRIKEFNLCYMPLRAMVSVSSPTGIIAINSRLKDPQKEKEALAHECGHCLTGCFYNMSADRLTKLRCEYKADRKAIELLIPQTDLFEAITNGCKEIWSLAEYFDVSEEFMHKALKIYGFIG